MVTRHPPLWCILSYRQVTNFRWRMHHTLWFTLKIAESPELKQIELFCNALHHAT